ncbi:PepSY-associated TM helix domain-containing protein [Flavitalea flava]
MKTKRKTLKYWIGQIHLWLGLASGLVVLIVSITGCLFVFQKDITEFVYKDIYFVKPVLTATLPLSRLQKTAQEALGAAQPIEGITAYRQPDRAWEFMAYKNNDTALTYFGAMEYFRSVLVNPYTGEVTGIRDYKYDFFSIVKYIHWSLLLNTPYGQPIVGWSTLTFVLLLITGLVLWWPKKWTKAFKDRSFKINWKASFKRVNYDMHNVPGFYSLLPALIISLTGMVFAFGWFQSLVYAAASGTTSPPVQIVVKSVPPAADSVKTIGFNPFDIAFKEAFVQLPGSERIGLSPASGKEGTIYAFGYKGKQVYYGSDLLQFDQYSGKLLHRRNNSEKNRGERLIEMNYDIHVGAIGGLTGKILAFIISLICASLPLTGFLVWWGKRKKKHIPKPKSAALLAAVR